MLHYISVAIRKQAKIVTRHGKGTNKIWETHTFWRNFFNHGEIWLHAFTRYRLNTGSEMPQYHRISVQRDSPFADERLFLWRLMRGRRNVTTDAPSLVSSYPSYMQLWYHPQSHQESSGRVERGSFTLTLSQNRAWKSPLTRLFTLNVLCIDIIWGLTSLPMIEKTAFFARYLLQPLKSKWICRSGSDL